MSDVGKGRVVIHNYMSFTSRDGVEWTEENLLDDPETRERLEQAGVEVRDDDPV